MDGSTLGANNHGQMGICRRQRKGQVGGMGGRDAVGEAHRAPAVVVMASTQQPGIEHDVSRGVHDVGAESAEVGYSFLLRSPGPP